MKYKKVLWFAFAATLCFSLWGETALSWLALQSPTLECYQLQYTETAFCATALNIKKIKLYIIKGSTIQNTKKL